MTAQFQFLEDVALADTAFEAWGDSPSELFQIAAQAVIETMVNPVTVSPSRTQTIERKDSDLPALLFDWLSEIVYLKDAQGLVFREVLTSVNRDPTTGTWTLDATLVGEEINPARHELHGDVKAVTKHLYEVRREGSRWIARVVLDV